MTKTCVIVGMIGPYEGPTPEGLEIWGCNKTYLHQKNFDRVYFLDDLECYENPEKNMEKKEFVDNLNALDIPIYAQKHYEEIPKSIELPVERMVSFFGGGVNNRNIHFTSTVAYMFAHAIYEEFEKIIIHRLFCYAKSYDYTDQKPNMDFWAGQAIARGVEVEISRDSHICKPFPWQAKFYGLERERPEIKAFIDAGFREVFDVV